MEFGGKSDIAKQLLPPELRRYVLEGLSLASRFKDQVEEMLGAAVVELAELAGLNNQTMSHAKAWLTKQFDKVRLTYRPDAERIPRRCAFIGTKNTEDKLPHDPSGSTRWGIVECPQRVDMEAVFAVEGYREQLFAEALTLVDSPAFRGGFNFAMMEAQAEQNVEHEDRNHDMALAVEQFAEEGTEGLTSLEMAQEAGFVRRYDCLLYTSPSPRDS